MRRWGQIAHAHPDSWYVDVAKSVYKPKIYLKAAKSLIQDGAAPRSARARPASRLISVGLPGPERGMVFQSYSLMPWLTVQGNVGLAVRPRQIHRADHDGGAERGVEGRKGGIKLDGFEVSGADPERAVGVERVYPDATRAERQDVVEYYLERVGLSDAMDRPAAQMSMGMQQRMGIARAFALSPKLLLLDEPFGMLDSLTRWELQDVLMVVWSRTRVTTVCVTHDVDEAILLADRVVMMTNGPRATIGNSMKVDLPRPRPRSRKALLQHPDYYAYREELIGFLADHDRHARKGARKEEAA